MKKRKRAFKGKRIDEFARWIQSHVRNPAVTLMQISGTPPELLVGRSAKTTMSFGDAQNLRARCADILLPYIEGNKPIVVELDVNGDCEPFPGYIAHCKMMERIEKSVLIAVIGEDMAYLINLLAAEAKEVVRPSRLCANDDDDDE